MRQLAQVARTYVGDNVRTTVEQNLVLRWVSEADLPALYRELQRLDLALGGAGKIEDVVACPGTDTCKLGIAASRGLAAELHERLVQRQKHGEIDPAVRDLHLKMSGCFNSCGQHHLADIGFYGVSRKIGGATVPHFRVLMGGEWENNGATYGLTIGAVPSKRIPEFIDHVTPRYVAERQHGERFKDYVGRIGKKALKEMVDAFSAVPPYAVDRSLYSDWRDPREFTTSDITTGECAGEVVLQIEFDLQAAEQRNFEAQIHLEQGEIQKADEAAYQSMLIAAKGLVRTQLWDLPDDPDRIVAEFRTRFYETQLFQSPDAGQYAGGKFALYLLNRHADRDRAIHRREGAPPGGGSSAVHRGSLRLLSADERAAGAAKASFAVPEAAEAIGLGPMDLHKFGIKFFAVRRRADRHPQTDPDLPPLDPAGRCWRTCSSTWPTTATSPAARASCSSPTRATTPWTRAVTSAACSITASSDSPASCPKGWRRSRARRSRPPSS